jgi:hypothetical protein
VIDGNAEEGVTWISSYASDDKTHTFCVYDAPTPEAMRKTAARNQLPVDQITRVTVLDPYFYSWVRRNTMSNIQHIRRGVTGWCRRGGDQLPGCGAGDTAAGRPAVHAELELGRARRPEHVDERAAWVPVGRTRRSARPERSCCSAPAHRPQAWRAADAGTVR